MTIHADDIPIAQFCALEYRTGEIDCPSVPERVLILFLRNEGGSLRVFSRRDWRKVVQLQDLEYVGDLLADFKERSKSGPGALFRQVAALSVGPLVTYAMGSGADLKAAGALLDVWENMVEL
jgi:hypothetical protein